MSIRLSTYRIIVVNDGSMRHSGQNFLRFLQEKDQSIDSDFLSEASSIGAIHATRSDEKINAFYSKASKKLVSELFDADFRTLRIQLKINAFGQ